MTARSLSLIIHKKKKKSEMSLDDTQSIAENIVNSVIHDVRCELDNEQSPSTDYESIHSSPELHKLVLLV